MAVQGINPVRAQPKKDALDKIAQGLNIAQGILGVTLAIPEAIAKGKERKQLGELREAQIAKTKAETLTPEEQQVEREIKTAGLLGQIGKSFRPAREGEKPDVTFAPQFGGAMMYRDQPSQISELDKKLLDVYSKDFVIAQPGEKDAQRMTIGDRDIYFKPRGMEPGKIGDRETNLRKEFLTQSKEFIAQTAAAGRVEASAKDPSPAGDLAMLFNYMKILDPGSVVRESEFRTASETGAIPERIKAFRNRVLAGERLSDTIRKDFLDRARRLYKSAQALHKNRESFYTQIAVESDLDPGRIVPRLGLNIKEEITKKPPNQDDAGAF